MASESGMKDPSTPMSSNSVESSYIGSFISLISKCDVRYEGVLSSLNIHNSTIALNNVRSYGTEGRRKDGPQVPPSDKVYEYILFRGNDIKNLQIKSPSTSTKAEEQIFNDPAIIQSKHFGMLSSPVASVGGRMTESIQRQDSPAMSSKSLPVGFPSHQSVTPLGPSNQFAASQVASHPSFSTAMYRQGHNETSNNSSHSLLQSSSLQPPLVISPLPTQSCTLPTETQAPTKVGWTTLSEYGLPISSIMPSSLLNPTRSPASTSSQISDSLDIPSPFSTKTLMPNSTSGNFDGPKMPLNSSPLRDINSIEGQIYGQNFPDPRPIYPQHSVHHPAIPFVDSTSVPLPKPSFLLTPDQFAHPREQLYSLTQNLNPNPNDMGSLTLASSGSSVLMPSPASSASSVLIPSPASQAPLLPLPTSVQKYSAPQFTEEFDFVAMNEKFKKDEVWGSLGKAATKIEGVEGNAPPLNVSDRECDHGTIPNPKSAYKKDDFFDTISCNSMTRGSRNGQHRLSERMKLDTETFGNFQQRPISYGGYGAGRGENFRGSYNWGRGYGYGGRGRGPNYPF